MTLEKPSTKTRGIPSHEKERRLYERAKRLIDVSAAVVGLTVSSPILVLSTVLIKLNDRGPVLHKRVVLARGGGSFPAYKLRTMIVDADRYMKSHPELLDSFEDSYKLKDDPRVTRVGKWLRKLSLDELPQLANVLRGQMSLVGPRMISPAELEKYGKYKETLLTVKPGLTGLWQVSGRQETDYAERVSLDMEYIKRRSLLLDLQIVLRTIPMLLLRRGAY